ncbi:MAG: hypothetical protein ACQEQF_00570 [Bacillota bacterium]
MGKGKEWYKTKATTDPREEKADYYRDGLSLYKEKRWSGTLRGFDKLEPKQRQFLQYIMDCYRQEFKFPSIRRMSEVFDMNYRQTRYVVQDLEELGAIIIKPRNGIRLTEPWLLRALTRNAQKNKKPAK